MAFVTADRVRDTSTTAGSGSFSVSGTAPTGYRTFSAVLSVSDTFYYSIQHQTLNEWEVGLGTYSSANTFARTTIYSSSNAGSAVTFSAGTKDVFITMAAARSPQLDASGNSSISGTQVMGSSFLRNRIINGNMYVAQRATSATVTAGTAVPTASTGYPCVDRFFVYSTGANVTAAQVAGSGSNRNLLQITGAASVTAVGIGQRIESLNSYDLSGKTCTLSVSLANSLLTTVTWTASYATTTDTFGTIGTPTKTQIATGTFTVNSTLTRYSTNISVPAAATTGIEILFTVAAQTSGTWQIDDVQFEEGSIATPFERPIYQTQLEQCQRYCYVYVPSSASGQNSIIGVGTAYSTTSAFITLPFPVVLRIVPTLSYTGALGNFYGMYVSAITYSALNAISVNGFTNCQVAFVAIGYGAIASAGQAMNLISDNTKAGYLIFSSEM
jgi:hypothetical protein